MSEELTQQKVLTTEELLSDFFFLVFHPNPRKNIVRIIIDDGSIKLYTNTQKFIKIIEGIMNEKTGMIVKNCCETYGCYYVIDRCEGTVRKLNITSERNILSLKQLHSEIEKAKEAGESDSVLREKYIETLNGFIDQKVKKGIESKVYGNKYSSTIIYGQQSQQGYRPY